MEWKPMELLRPNNSSDQCKYAILILNQPVLNPELFSRVWNKADFRMAVDGGGNQWAEIRKTFPDLLYPQIVSGDLDSVRPEVLQDFTEHGTEVVPTPNQDETDFTKALRVLCSTNEAKSLNISKAIAFCESSGRFDQIMANMETLFHAVNIFAAKFQLYLMGSTSMTWLLSKGSHKINCFNESSRNELQVKYCSLIPIGTPCTLTTQGLKWNLNDDILAFGKLVSTSNEIDKSNNTKVISITNSETIVWSMEFE